LGIALPIIGFGAYGTWNTVDSFTAETQVLIQGRSVEDPSFRSLSVDYDILMNTASQIVQSIPVATLTADIIFDDVQSLIKEEGLLFEINTKEELRDHILGNVGSGSVGESNILSLSFADVNPRMALLVVAGLEKAFMEYWIEGRRNSSALEYYSEQIEIVQDEIDGLMGDRANIIVEGGINAIPANNSAGIHQMRQMEYSFFIARSTRMEVEGQLIETNRRIRENPDDMPTLAGASLNEGMRTTFFDWQKSRIELAKLRTSYQDSSVQVQQQMDYVSVVRGLYIDARNNLVKDLEVSLSIAKAKEASLQDALDQYKEGLSVFPTLEKDISSFDIRINTQRDLLEALIMKRGEVRLKAESDQRISNITLLNEPTIKYGVSGGKKMMYLIMTVVFALILGVVVALLTDAQDHRIFDRRQAEIKLEVPVLGAISTMQLPAGKR
jgi:capsular polysaccharide biosynthesis protein